MKFVVTESTAEWHKQALDLTEEDVILFVKCNGGHPFIYPIYSPGTSKEEPGDISVSDKKAGITFSFVMQDEWLMKSRSLIVNFKNGEM